MPAILANRRFRLIAAAAAVAVVVLVAVISWWYPQKQAVDAAATSIAAAFAANAAGRPVEVGLPYLAPFSDEGATAGESTRLRKKYLPPLRFLDVTSRSGERLGGITLEPAGAGEVRVIVTKGSGNLIAAEFYMKPSAQGDWEFGR